MLVDRRLLLASLLALAVMPASNALADRGESDDDQHGRSRRSGRRDQDDRDHQAAARALAAGEIRPLEEILEIVRKAHPGEIAGIEFERKDGRWLYEIKLITPDSRYVEIYVDAHDKQIIKIEGK